MESAMLHAAGQALLIMMDPHRLMYLFAGVCMGLGLGILPGIGGIAGTALLLPFTEDAVPEVDIAARRITVDPPVLVGEQGDAA